MVVGGRELIDTLWNVNLHEYEKHTDWYEELIDTLWNVNNICRIFPTGLLGN